MRRLLFLVCLVVFVETMLYSALVPLLPGYAHEFGLSKSAAGLLVGAYAAGAVLGALPGGIVAARYGPRRALLFALVLIGLASLAFGFAGSAWTLGIARLAQGLGGSLAWAAALTWLIVGTPRARRGEMLGTAIGSAIFGALLGPAIGALAHHVGSRPVFVGLAALTVVLGAWALRIPPVEGEPLRRGVVVRALREPQVLGALWLMTIPALVFGVVGVLVPLALDRAGWSAAAIAIAWIASAAIEMVIAPLIGRVSDRRGRLLPLRVSLGGAVGVLIAFALSDRPAAVVPVLVLSGITFGAFWAPAMALLSDAADRIGLAQGLAFGLMNAAWGAGNALGPPIGGALADAATDAVPYALAALMCAATLVFTFFRPGTQELRVPESP
ncbi:MAG TPA: MFS transporter [Gaiellaceae bacterium]|nr:MFS transporter [Gaiellaceae bacterium]